jgi:predicted DNA-binding antitoxin AbrB/MazE fold protein
MNLKGIIKGQSIELLEPINLADGSEVTIEISNLESEVKPNWTELQKVIGVWQKDIEIQEIFA